MRPLQPSNHSLNHRDTPALRVKAAYPRQDVVVKATAASDWCMMKWALVTGGTGPYKRLAWLRRRGALRCMLRKGVTPSGPSSRAQAPMYAHPQPLGRQPWPWPGRLPPAGGRRQARAAHGARRGGGCAASRPRGSAGERRRGRPAAARAPASASTAPCSSEPESSSAAAAASTAGHDEVSWSFVLLSRSRTQQTIADDKSQSNETTHPVIISRGAHNKLRASFRWLPPPAGATTAAAVENGCVPPAHLGASEVLRERNPEVGGDLVSEPL